MLKTWKCATHILNRHLKLYTETVHWVSITYFFFCFLLKIYLKFDQRFLIRGTLQCRANNSKVPKNVSIFFNSNLRCLYQERKMAGLITELYVYNRIKHFKDYSLVWVGLIIVGFRFGFAGISECFPWWTCRIIERLWTGFRGRVVMWRHILVAVRTSTETSMPSILSIQNKTRKVSNPGLLCNKGHIIIAMMRLLKTLGWHIGKLRFNWYRTRKDCIKMITLQLHTDGQ